MAGGYRDINGAPLYPQAIVRYGRTKSLLCSGDILARDEESITLRVGRDPEPTRFVRSEVTITYEEEPS